MTAQTITIPAREVRPGDVLFGMTVETSVESFVPGKRKRFINCVAFAMNIDPDHEVTVERPVPSDPIGTVRAEFADVHCITVYRKYGEDVWFRDRDEVEHNESDVADLPILWKPGMPIPNTEVTA